MSKASKKANKSTAAVVAAAATDEKVTVTTTVTKKAVVATSKKSGTAVAIKTATTTTTATTTASAAKRAALPNDESSPAAIASLDQFLTRYAKEIEKKDNGKIRCLVTGHDIPFKLTDLLAHWSGRVYRREKKKWSLEHEFDINKYGPWIILSKRQPTKVFCKLTKMFLNKNDEELQRHLKGRKYQYHLALKNARKAKVRPAPTEEQKLLWAQKNKDRTDGDGDLWDHLPAGVESDHDNDDDDNNVDEADFEVVAGGSNGAADYSDDNDNKTAATGAKESKRSGKKVTIKAPLDEPTGDVISPPVPGGILAKKGASRRAGKEGSVAPVKIKSKAANNKKSSTVATATVAGNGVGVAALNNGASSSSRRKAIHLDVDVSAAANATSVPLNDDGSIDLAAIGSGPSSLVAHKKNRKRTRPAKPSRNAHKKASDADAPTYATAFAEAAANMDINNDETPSASKKKARRGPSAAAAANDDNNGAPPEDTQPVSKGAFKKLGKGKK